MIVCAHDGMMSDMTGAAKLLYDAYFGHTGNGSQIVELADEWPVNV